MATADSVFTKVAEDLLSGAVLVGQLELIWKHRARFLDIWELSEGRGHRGVVAQGSQRLVLEGLFLPRE